MYNKRDKGLFKNVREKKFNQNAYLGSYVITAIRKNGIIRACKKEVHSIQGLNAPPFLGCMTFTIIHTAAESAKTCYK